MSKRSILGKVSKGSDFYSLDPASSQILVPAGPQSLNSTSFRVCQRTSCFASSSENGNVIFGQGNQNELLAICKNGVFDVAWDSTGSRLFCGTSHGEIAQIDVEYSKTVMRCQATKGDFLLRTLHMKKELLAWGSVNGSFGIYDSRSNENAVVNCSEPHRIKGLQSCGIGAVQLTLSGLLLTAGSTDGMIKVWDSRKVHLPVNEIQRLKPFTFKGQGIVSLDLNPINERMLVSSRRGGDITIHDLHSEGILEVRRLALQSNDMLNTVNGGVHFSPDGHYLGVNGLEGCFVIPLEAAHQTLHLELDGSNAFSGCDFYQDESFGAVTHGGAVVQWQRRMFCQGSKQRSRLSNSHVIESRTKRIKG